MPLHCLYVGDSDISRWPLSDQRKSSSVIYEPDLRLHLPTSRISKSGWTSFEVESHLRRQLEADPQSIRPKEGDYVVVACWGENDLSDCQAVNMASIKTTVNNTMEAIKHLSGFTHLLFFGPKLEPWMFLDPLDVDVDSMLAYARLSSELISAFENIPQCTFIDALGMTTTDDIAKTTGEMMAEIQHAKVKSKVTSADELSFMVDESLFCEDKLHLSPDGYLLWNDIVEPFTGHQRDK